MALLWRTLRRSRLAAKAPCEERKQPGIEILAVLRLVVAVALVAVVAGLHLYPGGLQRTLHRLGMLDRRGLVLAACGQQHGALDRRCMAGWLTPGAPGRA